MNEDRTVYLTGNAPISMHVSRKQLAYALKKIAWEMCGEPDDDDVEWFTDDQDNTWLAHEPGSQRRVSGNPKVAALIRAMWILEGHELCHGKLEEFLRDE